MDVPSLGIEPAANVAAAAEEKDVSTLVRFLGVELAEELTAHGRSADLLIGNNVLHQVPDPNDSVSESNLLINAGFFALRQEKFDPRRLITFAVGTAHPACDIHAGLDGRVTASFPVRS